MTNIGVIGCGGIASLHLQAAAKLRGARVVHVADARVGAAESPAEHFGVARASGNAMAVIHDNDVDMVIVALPTHLHPRFIAAAAKAGKDILTEKPLARRVSQARRILEVVRRSGVRLAVGHQDRWIPTAEDLARLVHDGRVGAPVTWSQFTSEPRSDCGRGPGNWMWDFKKGGGMVMDYLVHGFDLAVSVFGRPVEMFARAERLCPSVDSPTDVLGSVRFANDNLLNFQYIAQDGAYERNSHSRLYGPDGVIDFVPGGLALTTSTGKVRKLTHDINKLSPRGLGGLWPFYRQLRAFVDDAPGLVSGREALGSLWIAENAVAAPRSGRRFRFPRT